MSLSHVPPTSLLENTIATYKAENARLHNLAESLLAKLAARDAVLAKVREDLLDRAKIAAERKDESTDGREREYYSGQYELAAMLIPISGAAAGESE